MHLLVQPGGSKLWRLAYRFDDEQRTMSFGAYPVSRCREVTRNALMFTLLTWARSSPERSTASRFPRTR